MKRCFTIRKIVSEIHHTISEVFPSAELMPNPPLYCSKVQNLTWNCSNPTKEEHPGGLFLQVQVPQYLGCSGFFRKYSELISKICIKSIVQTCKTLLKSKAGYQNCNVVLNNDVHMKIKFQHIKALLAMSNDLYPTMHENTI